MRNRSSHKKDSNRNAINMSNIPPVNMFNPGASIIIENNQQPSQPNTQRILTQSDMNSSQLLSNTSQLLSNNNNNSSINNDKKLQISQLQTSQYLKKSVVIEKDRHTPSFNNKQSSYFQQNQGGYFGGEQNKSSTVLNDGNNSSTSQLNNSTSKSINSQLSAPQSQTQNSFNKSNVNQQSTSSISQNIQQPQVLTHSSSFSNLSSSKINLNSSINHNRQSSVLKQSINNSIGQISSTLNQSQQYLNTSSTNSHAHNSSHHQHSKSHLQQHPPLPHSASSLGLANANRGQLHHTQNSISSHLNNSLLRDDKRNVGNSTLDSARDSFKKNAQNTSSSILKPHYFSTADYNKCNTQRSLSHNNSSRDVNQLHTSREMGSSSATTISTSNQLINENKNKENYKPILGESTTRQVSYLH